MVIRGGGSGGGVGVGGEVRPWLGLRVQACNHWILASEKRCG